MTATTSTATTGMSRDTGRRMERRDHIRQSITDILTTPVGSRVMRRDYGSLLPELIDQPLNDSGILRLKAATADALVRQEPRITLQRVSLTLDDSAGITVDIDATDADGATAGLSVPLGLKGVLT